MGAPGDGTGRSSGVSSIIGHRSVQPSVARAVVSASDPDVFVGGELGRLRVLKAADVGPSDRGAWVLRDGDQEAFIQNEVVELVVERLPLGGVWLRA